MINGGNRDEMRLYVGYEVEAGSPITPDNYLTRLKATYGDFADRIAVAYPLSQYSSAPAAVGRVESDFTPGNALNNCIFLDSARLMSRHTSVYEYEFTDGDAPPVMDNPGFEMGAVHSAELPYFYPHVSYNQRRNGQDVVASSQGLSRQMIAYWGQFAQTGNPNRAGLPKWPQFKTVKDVMILDPKQIGPADAATAHQCSFWQELYPAAFRASTD
jgi:para-nitrobenzyl esterase